MEQKVFNLYLCEDVKVTGFANPIEVYKLS